jgi:hypothetical protein
MGIKRICLDHKLELTTPEMENAHIMCRVFESGSSGFGGIEAVNSDNRSLNEPVVYEAGIILPYDTQAEKEARMKGRGAPPAK